MDFQPFCPVSEDVDIRGHRSHGKRVEVRVDQRPTDRVPFAILVFCDALFIDQLACAALERAFRPAQGPLLPIFCFEPLGFHRIRPVKAKI